MRGLRARLVALVTLAVAIVVASLALFSRHVVTSEYRRIERRQPARGFAAAAGAVSRAWAAHRDWRGADSLLAALAPATGHALVLLDTTGSVVAASNRVLTRTRFESGPDGVLRLRADDRSPAGLQLELHNPERLVLRVDGRPQAVLVALPEEAGATPPFLRAVDRSLALGVAAALLLGLALAWLVGDRIVGPVARLGEATRRVAGGDLSARVEVRGDDELARLGRRFNAMAEALAGQAARRKQLTADVAHELRTPLGHLRAHVEAVEDGLVPLDARALATVHAEVQRLTRLVEDLEQLALDDAGELAIALADVPAEAALREAARAVEAACAERGIAARVAVEGAPVARADRRRLAQVLSNLLENALAHSPAASTITLFARTRGDRVELGVADQGVGIAPAHQARVFERFYRADPSRSRATGGAGLGLAIVKHLVEAQGGRVTLASEEGRGTTVTVSLPRAGED